MEFFFIMIPVFLLVAVVIRLAAGSMDRQRIEGYLADRGCRVISVTWSPFGKGWFGEKRDRIYEVVYYDGQGNQHMAACKTSLWGGVYFTEDRIAHRRAGWADRLPEFEARGEPLIRSLDPQGDEDELARLRQENTRLREELDRLHPGGTP